MKRGIGRFVHRTPGTGGLLPHPPALLSTPAVVVAGLVRLSRTTRDVAIRRTGS